MRSPGYSNRLLKDITRSQQAFAGGEEILNWHDFLKMRWMSLGMIASIAVWPAINR